MKFKKRLGRKLLNVVPNYNDNLDKICQRYVDQFKRVNNSNLKTNGEYFFLPNVIIRLAAGVEIARPVRYGIFTVPFWGV